MHVRRGVLALGLALVACGSGAPVVPSAPTPSATGAEGPPPPPPHFPDGWAYAQGAPSPRSSRGMVSTDAALATRVGVDVLASGGNAVDAAVATAFVLAVAFPQAGNIGGGGFLVARVAGKSYALDFRETAPAAATRDMYLGPDGKTTRESREGWRSAGVPGSVAGLYEAWRTLGSKNKTWAEVLAPAVALADKGFTVDAAFIKTIAIVRDRLAHS